ncbi:MAG: metallophosphoesterase [Succinivibrionaceae bacterium]|nr:metallophosphoesterase [Succinivibrionaceae bacterium]
MIFITSDPHFSHQNIIRYCGRPYASSEEMDEGLVSRWNETVSDADEVWILGDLSLDLPPSRLRPIVSRLKGELHLVPGNHDRRLVRDPQALGDLITVERDLCTIRRHEGGRDCTLVLCHYPLMTWPGLLDPGVYHFFGHIHNQPWQNQQFSRIYGSLNVGMDCWGLRPMPLGDLLAAVDRKNGSLAAGEALNIGPGLRE